MLRILVLKVNIKLAVGLVHELHDHASYRLELDVSEYRNI